MSVIQQRDVGRMGAIEPTHGSYTDSDTDSDITGRRQVSQTKVAVGQG